MSFTLRQKITYWTTSGTNANSEPTFSGPLTIDAQYALKDGVSTNDKGDEVNVSWIIYSKIEIPKRSLIVLGSNSDLTPPNKARMMIDNKSNPYFTNLFKSMA